MKKYFALMAIASLVFATRAASQLTSQKMVMYVNVYDEYEMPVHGAIVRLEKSGGSGTTLRNGKFRLFRPLVADILIVSVKGFKERRIKVGADTPTVLTVHLERQVRKAPFRTKRFAE